MILSNQVECLQCGDKPFSTHRHDFRYCKCGAVAVDGGMDYLRRLGSPENMREMSIVIEDEVVEELKTAVSDKTKNPLGLVCNVVRILRDKEVTI